ncbi:MAG: hypothetical protein R2827_14415 [Bdellovibrionales bacterium]
MSALIRISAFLFLTFSVSSVWASKARLGSLGQDPNGSFHIEDPRNIFLNPAKIADLADQVSLEAGASSITSSPKAEGGIIHNHDGYTLGVHLGRAGDISTVIDLAQSLTSAASSYFSPQNPIEIFWGQRSSSGRSIGASVLYANSKSEQSDGVDYPDSSGSILTVAGGIVERDWEAQGKLYLLHNSKTDTSAVAKTEYEGSPSLSIGGAKRLDQNTKVSGSLYWLKFDFDNGTIEGSNDTQTINGTYHKTLKSIDGTLVFASGGLTYSNTATKFDGVSSELKVNLLYLPVIVGLERPVNSWLTLRGSITQNVLLDESTTEGASKLKTSGLDDTTVSAGLSLTFDQLSVDATFEGFDDSTAELNGDKLMANVSLNYVF